MSGLSNTALGLFDDPDGDLVGSNIDNCPTTYNPGQEDTNHNGIGDACGCQVIGCSALDQCHVVGVCNPTTDRCSNPTASNGTACNDGDICTQNDACIGGVCAGIPTSCTPIDSCHESNCDPSTGLCTSFEADNPAGCDDGSACTQEDRCFHGACAGTPVVCVASDQCHVAGTCNNVTGLCSNPAKPDGTTCDDGIPCTFGDNCRLGVCQWSSNTCSGGGGPRPPPPSVPGMGPRKLMRTGSEGGTEWNSTPSKMASKGEHDLSLEMLLSLAEGEGRPVSARRVAGDGRVNASVNVWVIRRGNPVSLTFDAHGGQITARSMITNTSDRVLAKENANVMRRAEKSLRAAVVEAEAQSDLPIVTISPLLNDGQPFAEVVVVGSDGPRTLSISLE